MKNDGALWLEFQHVLRHLRRTPGFALTVVFTLALGIAATITVFSLVDEILLRPLPLPGQERLMVLETLQFPDPVGTNSNAAPVDSTDASYPDYFAWKHLSHSFASFGSIASSARLFSLPNGENVRVIPAARVSASLFDMLGVKPFLGRNFLPEEELPGHRCAILSYSLWVSDFASSRDVIGKTIRVSDEITTIIGVMPRGFYVPGSDQEQLWTTFAPDTEGPNPFINVRDRGVVMVIGRLKADASLDQAQAEMNAIQRGLAQQYPEDATRYSIRITSLIDYVVYGFRSMLHILFAAVGVLLLITCVNIAGLVTARASKQRGELAVRVALGATHGQILRQFMMESLFLSLSAGALGVLLARWLLRAVIVIVPDDLPRLAELSIDGRIVTFALLLAVFTTLLFGLLPALRLLRADPINAMRESSQGTTAGRGQNRLQGVLIIAETAMSMVLLIGSGLLIHSLVETLRVDLGFNPDQKLLFGVPLSAKRYPDPQKVRFYDQLLPKLAALPGVQAATGAFPLPLWGWGGPYLFTIDGRPAGLRHQFQARAVVTEPGYFEVIGIPLLHGRTFVRQDHNPQAPAVVIVNQTFAKKYFPGEDPLGHQIIPDFSVPGEALVPREVVGVVGNVKQNSLMDEDPPELFLPYAQAASLQRPNVLLKVVGDPANYESAVRKLILGIDHDLPIYSFRTFPDIIQNSTRPQRFAMILVSSFAAVSMLLAGIGFYAVLAYMVARRQREIGLRIALGARRSNVLWLILGHGLGLVLAGIAIGSLTAMLVSRLIAGMLFGVSLYDGATYGAVCALLLTLSVVASAIPALDAARVDPVTMLRQN